VTAAAKDLVELVRALWAARDPRSAVFVMELFRGSPTARNKAAVSPLCLSVSIAGLGIAMCILMYTVVSLAGQSKCPIQWTL
jgi:hypothetical protein